MELSETNLTAVTGFFLLGFQGSQLLRIILFLLFFAVFGATICGNFLIILFVSIRKTLHTPMYFFISQLSINDILLPMDVVPNMLHILLNNGGTITFTQCFTQFYFFGVSETFECLLLSVMSYDRYVAICNPLRYTSIMTSALCVTLATMCWLLSIFISFILSISLSKLKFGGHNIIDHVLCDPVPLLKLTSSNTFFVYLEIYFIGAPVIIIPTTIIVMSYTYIVRAVLRIPSSIGRHKAFSTCSSHLIVVSIFYGTIFGVYVLPKSGQTWVVNKVLSLFYTVFSPLINPIIYSLRNKDIKKAIQETLHRHIF